MARSLFVLSAIAHKFTAIGLANGNKFTFGVDEEEFIRKTGMGFALEELPTSEGWTGHRFEIIQIPDDVILALADEIRARGEA